MQTVHVECSRQVDEQMRRPDLVTRLVNGEVIILDRAAGNVHQLNATASHVWNECDGTRSAADIAAGMAARFDVSSDVILRDVLTIIADFRQLGLFVDERTVSNSGQNGDNNDHRQ
jgi:hypothetical protein